MKNNTFLGQVIVATIDKLGTTIPQKAFYRLVENYMFRKKIDNFQVSIRPTKDILENKTVQVSYFEHRCSWFEKDEDKKDRKRSGRYNLS
jgi:hypothetical protein